MGGSQKLSLKKSLASWWLPVTPTFISWTSGGCPPYKKDYDLTLPSPCTSPLIIGSSVPTSNSLAFLPIHVYIATYDDSLCASIHQQWQFCVPKLSCLDVYCVFDLCLCGDTSTLTKSMRSQSFDVHMLRHLCTLNAQTWLAAFPIHCMCVDLTSVITSRQCDS